MLIKVCAWEDVLNKAEEIVELGGVQIINITDTYAEAEVVGMAGIYHTVVNYDYNANRKPLTRLDMKRLGWECTCPWGHYAWDARKGKYIGRPCSHAWALRTVILKNWDNIGEYLRSEDGTD